MHEIMRRWFPPRVADLEIRPEDLGIYDDGDGGRTDYYSWYRWVATVARARVVVEIGARLGYSACALAAPGVGEIFIGIDNECYIAGSNGLARPMLEKHYSTVFLHILDSQVVTSLVPLLHGHTPDVIHIDGDHSFAGCLHDLELAHQVLGCGGVIVVDDASAELEPGKACAEFYRQHPDYALMTFGAAFSYRGHQILVRLN